MIFGSLFALLSSVLSGITPNLLRNVTRRVHPIYVNSFKLLFALIFFSFFLPFIIPENLSQISLRSILLTIFISFSGPFVAWTSYMYAISKSDVSLVHPVMGTYPAYAILYDFIFFSVKPNILSIFGYFFIIFGLCFISRDDSGTRVSSKKGLPFAFFTAFLWGTNSFLFKIILEDINPLFLSYLRILFAIPFALPIMINFFVKKHKFSKRDFLLILLSGIIGDLFVVFFYFKSISLAHLFIVVPISATSPVFSALIAMFIHKEKIGLKRAIGITGALAGTLILVIVSYIFS